MRGGKLKSHVLILIRCFQKAGEYLSPKKSLSRFKKYLLRRSPTHRKGSFKFVICTLNPLDGTYPVSQNGDVKFFP